MKLIGKQIGRAAGILLTGSLLSVADLTTFNVNQSIPDYDETGLQNTQTLSGYSGTIESIEVSLYISGDPLAFGGDFFVSLQCENGGYVVLLNRVGTTISNPLGYSMNGFNVVFSFGSDDIHLAEDSSPTYDSEGRLIGTWGADGRNVDPGIVLDTDERTANLDSFTNINPNGDWTLFVADMSLNGTATLDSWGVDIITVPEPSTFLTFAGSLCVIIGARRRFRIYI